MAIVAAGTVDTIDKLKQFISTNAMDTLDVNSLTTGVYGEYEAARTAAEGLLNRPGLGARASATNPLGTLIDTIKAHTKGHETLVESLEGAIATDSRDFKRIIKEHQRTLKEHAGDLSSGIKEALGAHKEAHRVLSKQHAELTKELANTFSEATAAATNLEGKEAVAARYRNATSTLGSFFDRQKLSHERAVDHMKDIVETFAENGVKLKHDFNFNLAEKAVINRTSDLAKSAERAAEGAAGRAEEQAGRGGGKWLGIGLGVAGGIAARRALFSSPDEENGLVKDAVAGGIGGFIGRTVQTMFGKHANITAHQDYAELAKNALGHVRG